MVLFYRISPNGKFAAAPNPLADEMARAGIGLVCGLFNRRQRELFDGHPSAAFF